MPAMVVDHPLVSFGREVCGDLEAGLRREWLVTNGLGGYASGTVAGVAARRYHGWLVAALNPPVDRTVLVGGAVEWATYDGRRYPLSTHEYGDGTIDPHGYRHLQSFALEGTLPVWIFALADALLERRLWIRYGANTTYVMYRLIGGSRPVHLEITPLVTYRDFHSLTFGRNWRPDVEALADGLIVRAREGAIPFSIRADAGTVIPSGDWYWNFRHREETARGLDDRSDLYAPGTFSATVRPGGRLTLYLSAEDRSVTPGDRALDAERARQVLLLRRAAVERTDPVVQQLVLAADQFIVERRARVAPDETAPLVETAPKDAAADPGEGQVSAPGKTVIAGYHWFADWGRDTMIALPGLTVSTGRAGVARRILTTFARFVDRGMLPNRFPDAGEAPEYDTVDATLWYFEAIRAYHAATGDDALLTELFTVLEDIIRWHRNGTRYGIAEDPADGLLRSGEPGVQLTWMDAKVGDWVVTPRTGKVVEINALWYNAIRAMASFARRLRRSAEPWDALAERVRAGFERFWNEARGCCYDVVDGPEGNDDALRPNQIFAVSLPESPLPPERQRKVVDACARYLLTSHGLRSLAPGHPEYRGRYGGGPAERDGVYHQGTVWGWLLGPFALAHLRVYGDAETARAFLLPMAHHLGDYGVGSIAEIFDGDPPFSPRGCIAQAWSVSETLRAWIEVGDGGSKPARERPAGRERPRT